MKAPQIIFLVLVFLELVATTIKHGEMRMDRYNIEKKLFETFVTLAILYWGGFFG